MPPHLEDPYQQLSALLNAVEAELRQLRLWSLEAPPGSALQSTEPFACDQLFFHEWLQHIFLPRMTDIVQQGENLPGVCGIAPMAEECFRELSVDTARLINQLQAIDDLINQQGLQG